MKTPLFVMRNKQAIAKTAAIVIAVVIVVAVVAGVTVFLFSGSQPTQTATVSKPYRIAVFFSGGADNSWSVTGKNGIDQAVAYLQKTTRRAIEVQYVYSVSYGDIQSTLNSYASQGYDLLIAGDVPYEQATYAIANQFPNTQFLGYAGFSGPLPKNVGSISWDVWEGYFKAGVIAGLKTKTNVIGFVTAFSFAQSNEAINAYLEGAKLVNPNVKIVFSFTQDWHDPVKGRQAASALIAGGADVIAGMGNGMTDGVIKQAEDSGVYAVGYLYDENSIAPKTVLTSVLWNTTVYFLPGIEAAMGGQIGFKQIVLHLYPDKSAYLAPHHGTIPPDVEAKANGIFQKIDSGELKVPVNPELPKSS